MDATALHTKLWLRKASFVLHCVLTTSQTVHFCSLVAVSVLQRQLFHQSRKRSMSQLATNGKTQLRIGWAIGLASIIFCVPANAQQPSAAQVKFFETSIRPALVKYCYECHSVEAGDSRAGLLVDSREGLLEGGDSGPAIVPRDLDESVLWGAINWDGYEMPPSQKMPASVIADFKKWIAMGAPDPRERKLLHVNAKITADDIEEGRKHWAFQPPASPAGASIDNIVSAKLRSENMTPAEPADGHTLLRRLNFDLVGLPPNPSEISAFQIAFDKDRTAAIEAKVDELLDRPQYGERWGRHWLDVARYAESSGSRNISYPHAWRYRDFVIDSFNDDTPYDQFVAQQIAGDLLPAKTDEQWQKNLIATGFLAIGLKHQDQKNPRQFMSDMVDEQIDTTTQAVLGLTVACARCHDHKYDPIPTHDYYALAGVFYSTNTLYGTQRIAQNHRPSDLLLLPVLDKNTAPSGRQGTQAIADLKKRIQDLEQQMSAARRGRNSDDGPNKEFKSLRNAKNRLAGQLAAMNADGSKKTFGMGVQEHDEMINANILLGGEVDQPAQEVPRGFVQVLGDLNFTVSDRKSSGRRQLADAMTSEDNPLTARVMSNRIWMHLLGRPLVDTPNNFGFSGMRPSNQELLDHLAVRFMENGWSVKRMIKEIVLSDTYQRSSRYVEENYAVDPDNKLLWRNNPRQLDAEALRDAMLALSGQLNLTRPSGAQTSAAGAGRPGASSVNANDPHRSVYLPVIRDEPIDALALFDFPDANIGNAERQDSIVPTQALFVMNGEFVTSQAQSMAASLSRNFRSSDEQVQNAFLWAYGRPATSDELRASTQFFREFTPTKSTASGSSDGPTIQPARQRPRRGAQTGGAGPRGGGRRGMRGSAANASAASDSNNQALAVFCQTLMASARFRILN